MTSITLHYKKNTTGEQFGPPSGYRIDILRWDGQRATVDEEFEAYQQYSRDHVARFARRMKTEGYGESECLPGGFHMAVERSDGLPLTLDEIGAMVLTEMMKLKAVAIENEDFDTIESINSPRHVQEVVAALAPVGVTAWFSAIRQLKPGIEPQVVTIADSVGASVLLGAGLIEQFDGQVENLYAVPRSVAYCTFEFRP